ncbi:hypothetical protein CFP56_000455 [Quercus suber]|uniref:Uncharacterized protein n=1 Tax=Quercus suber TaxID=58331 RepID=A0AAW0M7N4_QUESU
MKKTTKPIVDDKKEEAVTIRAVSGDEEGRKRVEKTEVNTHKIDTLKYVEKKLMDKGVLRMDRHPADGIGIGKPPPKSGHGGKYTWEGPDDIAESELSEVPPAIDEKDPNYVDEEEEEKILKGEKSEVAGLVVGVVEVPKVVEEKEGVARIEVDPRLNNPETSQQKMKKTTKPIVDDKKEEAVTIRAVSGDEEGRKRVEKTEVNTHKIDTLKYVEKKLMDKGVLRMDRHPADGIGIGKPPPKSGHGGKYTWEGPDDIAESELSEVPPAIDEKDPNYVDEEEEEKILKGEKSEVAGLVVGVVEVPKVVEEKKGVARIEVDPHLNGWAGLLCSEPFLFAKREGKKYSSCS